MFSELHLGKRIKKFGGNAGFNKTLGAAMAQSVQSLNYGLDNRGNVIRF